MRFSKLLVLTGLVLVCNLGYGQGKTELSGGFGIPDFFNFRLNYGHNLRVGGYLGFIPFKFYGSSTSYWSFGAEISYHLPDKKDINKSPVWYVLGGLCFYHFDMGSKYDPYNIGFYPRAGRTIYFSKKSGINLDVGLFLPVSARSDMGPYDFKILFSGNAGFFFRFN